MIVKQLRTRPDAESGQVPSCLSLRQYVFQILSKLLKFKVKQTAIQADGNLFSSVRVKYIDVENEIYCVLYLLFIVSDVTSRITTLV